MMHSKSLLSTVLMSIVASSLTSSLLLSVNSDPIVDRYVENVAMRLAAENNSFAQQPINHSTSSNSNANSNVNANAFNAMSTSENEFNADQASSTSTAVNHPVVSDVFSTEEQQMLKSSKSVIISPLMMEQKATAAWMSGLKDMQQQIQKNSTQQGEADQIVTNALNENSKNEITVSVQDLTNQMASIYEFGAFHVVNELIASKGQQNQIPKMRASTTTSMAMQSLTNEGDVNQDEQQQQMQSPAAVSSNTISDNPNESGSQSSNTQQQQQQNVSSNVTEHGGSEMSSNSESDINAFNINSESEFDVNQNGSRNRNRGNREFCSKEVKRCSSLILNYRRQNCLRDLRGVCL